MARRHLATLCLTDEPDVDEIAALIDDTIERSGVYELVSNEDGTYRIYYADEADAPEVDDGN